MKNYLAGKDLEFEVKDVTADPSAQAEMAEMGMMAIPVTVIDGGAPILGADFKKIDKALGA